MWLQVLHIYALAASNTSTTLGWNKEHSPCKPMKCHECSSVHYLQLTGCSGKLGNDAIAPGRTCTSPTYRSLLLSLSNASFNHSRTATTIQKHQVGDHTCSKDHHLSTSVVVNEYLHQEPSMFTSALKFIYTQAHNNSDDNNQEKK